MPVLPEVGRGARADSWQPGRLHPNLSWTHYRTLLRVEKPEARAFYGLVSETVTLLFDADYYARRRLSLAELEEEPEFPELADITLFRTALSDSLVREEFFTRLDLADAMHLWLPHLRALDELLTERTKLVGVVHVSNVLGTVNPVKEIIARAHAKGIPVLVDGAQAVPHLQVDVKDLDADFYVFSGHKLSGPTGIGVLYGKLAHLEAMPPWHGGGNMIRSVSWEKTTYLPAPGKFEAGTPPIAAAIGLGAAIDYVTALGLDRIAAHEHELLAYASERLAAIPGLRILGTARNKASVLSFVVEGIHPHDMGSLLDGEGVVVRAGHHCAQPVMTRFNVPATTRASFAYFNTREEVDILVSAVMKAIELFK